MYNIAIQHDLVCLGSFEKPRTKTFYAKIEMTDAEEN